MFGIGWRHPHYGEVIERKPDVGFLEVHSENFFGQGGAALAVLDTAAQYYPISLHGVGLSLGSAMGLDEWHLDQLQRLVQRVQPLRVSDHACFARVSRLGLTASPEATHASDLLPIPFNSSALNVLCANVQRVQDTLQRPIAVENLSAYLAWPMDANSMQEAEFLSQLCQRTGCQLVLDLNNLVVNELNHQKKLAHKQALHPLEQADFDETVVRNCHDFVKAFAPGSIAEIHLAGHCDLGDIVIDDHGSRVPPTVWAVYERAVQFWREQTMRFDQLPDVLVEWDTDIPDLNVLLTECQMAKSKAHTLFEAQGSNVANHIALAALP